LPKKIRTKILFTNSGLTDGEANAPTGSSDAGPFLEMGPLNSVSYATQTIL